MAGTPSAKRTVETSLLLTGAAMSAFGAGVPAQAQGTEAQGQETEEASRQVQTLDGVVVTARKRDELAQEVPLSVSAIDGARLERMGGDNLRDIGGTFAAVFFNDSNSSPGEVRLRRLTTAGTGTTEAGRGGTGVGRTGKSR